MKTRIWKWPQHGHEVGIRGHVVAIKQSSLYTSTMFSKIIISSASANIQFVGHRISYAYVTPSLLGAIQKICDTFSALFRHPPPPPPHVTFFINLY
jgi:hypothetical protein